MTKHEPWIRNLLGIAGWLAIYGLACFIAREEPLFRQTILMALFVLVHKR